MLFMLRYLFLTAAIIAACNSTAPIKPEPLPDGGVGGNDATTSSASSSSSAGAGAGGQGGTGGLSCDPCTSADGARIVHQRMATTTLDGYKQIDNSGMFDTLRGETCSPLVAADGQRRCLPVGPSGVIYYADAMCTTSLFIVPVGGCLKSPVYVGEIVPIVGQCGSGIRILKLAGQHVGDAFVKSGATCSKVAMPPPNLYYGGAEIDPGAFAIVQQVESAP